MKTNIKWLYIIASCLFFLEGIENLPSQALFYYWKETLHYSESTIMYLGSIISIAWLIKPIIAYFINCFSTKKMWLIVPGMLSIITSAILGFTTLPIVILIIFLAINSAQSAIKNIAFNGLMCSEGKKHGLTGKIQSVEWGTLTIASILVGVIGGWMAQHFTYQICFLTLIPFYLLVLLFTFKYKEEKSIIEQKSSFLIILRNLFSDKQLLLLCLFIFLYNLAPSIGTPLMFIQRDTFHFSKIFIGWLGTIGAGCAVIGSALYYHFSKRINFHKWIFWSVIIGAVNSLCYLYYTPLTCVVYDITNSVIGIFITLMLLDFCAQRTKTGMETISFALLCATMNLTSALNGVIGGILLPIVGLQTLIIITSFTSFACLPLLKKIK